MKYSPSGGIGRHANFRCSCRKAWGFKSLLGHQTFMKHLEEIGETYWQHFWFALRIAFVLFLTSFILVFHAFFPNRQKETATSVIKHLHAIFEARKDGTYYQDDDDDTTPV